MVFLFFTILPTCCNFFGIVCFTFFQHDHSILAGGSNQAKVLSVRRLARRLPVC